MWQTDGQPEQHNVSGIVINTCMLHIVQSFAETDQKQNNYI